MVLFGRLVEYIDLQEPDLVQLQISIHISRIAQATFEFLFCPLCNCEVSKPSSTETRTSSMKW